MLRFLYKNVMGRVMLKLITRPIFSMIGGRALGSRLSRNFIGGYIRRNQIDMSRFEVKHYRTFNDFFTRRLKSKASLIISPAYNLSAPCDGKMSAYTITENSVFRIKNSRYTVGELIENNDLAREYAGGICLIFRLTPDDYHRYHYVDNGEITSQKVIKGELHTVRPIAHNHYPVFMRNTRVCTVMSTAHFGRVVQLEVGAMMVGKIKNHKDSGTFVCGEEKGCFEFGGSTIILLIKNGMVQIHEDLYHAAKHGDEIAVRVGDVIGNIC